MTRKYQNQHAQMWHGEPNTNNQTLPCRVHPLEGHQKKIQHPEQYKNSIGKRF